MYIIYVQTPGAPFFLLGVGLYACLRTSLISHLVFGVCALITFTNDIQHIVVYLFFFSSQLRWPPSYREPSPCEPPSIHPAPGYGRFKGSPDTPCSPWKKSWMKKKNLWRKTHFEKFSTPINNPGLNPSDLYPCREESAVLKGSMIRRHSADIIGCLLPPMWGGKPAIIVTFFFFSPWPFSNP